MNTGTSRGRGRSRLPAGQGSISGPWDHGLSRKQALNWLSHPGTPRQLILYILCWLLLVLLWVYCYFVISGGTLTLRMLTTILCLAFLFWCKCFSQESDYQLFAFVFFWIISYSIEIGSYGSLLLKFFSDTYLTILFGSLSQPRAISSSQSRFFTSKLCPSNLLTQVVSGLGIHEIKSF